MTCTVSDSFVAGSLSGVATRLLSSPLDVVKVRLQLQIEPISSQSGGQGKYGGMFHAARTIFKEEGLTAFWKGFLAGQLLHVVYGGTQFATYEVFRRSLLGRLSGNRVSLSGNAAINFVSGSVAGCTATLISFPFDILRTRMIGQGEPKIYSSLYRAMVLMHSQNGWKVFYRGLSPAVLSVTPQAGIYFCIFRLLCSIWETPSTKNESVKWLVSGGVAGVTSKFIMLPFDIVKKRLEVQGFEHARESFGQFHKYRGPLHCLRSIYRKEGLLAFYKGGTPALLKASFGISLSFTIYEHILKYLKQSKSRS